MIKLIDECNKQLIEKLLQILLTKIIFLYV